MTTDQTAQNDDLFLSSLALALRPDQPGFLRDRVVRVTDQLFLAGAIEFDRDTMSELLVEWEEAGITHYLAVHREFDAAEYIERHSTIEVIHIGVDDDLGRRDNAWFDAIREVSDEILSDPDNKLVVTCYLGVNRGPSAAVAILLSQGWELLPALRAVRSARPIANMAYAPDAARWWSEKNGGSAHDALAAFVEVHRWFERNPLDAGWVIRNIYASSRGPFL
jgi:hypothetical protein